MIKRLKIAGLSVAALLVLLSIFVLWLLHTESGTRAALGIARHWIPAGITFTEVHGTLSGPLQVSGFRYHDPAIAMDLRVDSASIDVALFAFLAKRLHVELADVSGLSLAFSTPEKPATTAPSTRDPWAAPLAMIFDKVRITKGAVRGAEGAPFIVNKLLLAGSWIGSGIEVRRLELDSPDGEVTLSALLGERAPKLRKLDATFRWLAGEHEWAGKLGAGGERETLAIDLALDAPVSAALRGNLARAEKRGTRQAWRAHVSVDPFNPKPLVETKAFDSVALELDADGDTSDLALRGVLSLGKDRIHLEELVLARREQRLDISSLRVRLNEERAAVSGSAKLALDGSAPASAQLAWDEFRLPDAWAGANFRCSGKIAVTASRERFAAIGAARLARGQRYSTLSLRVDGTRESLNIAELELTQTPGSLSVNGLVDLRKPLRWDLHSRARAFDPSLFIDAWPGALDFDLDTAGKWPEAGPDARFKLARLDGKLRGRAISGSGDISLNRELRPSGSLKLQSGGAAFDAVASSGPQPRVDANLRIASLEEWRKNLRGSVNAQLAAVGRWPRVDVRARAEATGFRGAGTAFESATLRLDGSDARAPRGKLELSARGLELAGFHFDKANAVLDGSQAAHELKLDVHGQPLTLALAAGGGWERATWTGAVRSLRLDIDDVPPLELQQPARLAIARDSLTLEHACLAGGEMSLCAAARQSRKVFAVNYSIHALPLGLITALTSPGSDVIVQGILEGGGELQRSADGTLSGNATLGSTHGLLAQGKADDTLRLEYRDFKVEANLSRESGQARVHGTLVGQGELDGVIQIAVREADPSLSGKASVELKDLAPLAWWVPQLAKMQGTGSLAVEVGGTLGTPRLAFIMAARGLEAEVPLLGLHLREGNITAKLKPEGSFEAEGAISSGEGSLRITGTQAESGMALSLKGSKFLAASIPGARITIAPDLALTGKPGKLALNGAVTLEEADVNLEKLTFSRKYSTSSDVVVVDREQQEGNRSLGLTTDVRILLGKNVKLAGYGLESTVDGELHITERPNETSRASGEIRVAGTYEAFGRKLDIERGRLQYAGTALDDPQLDILAARKLQDVTAKLRVTGTAQHPKLDVYTDPAMSQTDAMSYLLTGKPASDLHGEDNTMVQSAAQSVGSVLGNRLAKKLGGKMGLGAEVGVEQNADLGGSAFTVGKYLSPRLFVSYGIGLFEPGNAITVRYQFSERWSLEANDSPEDQHAGVRYRIEK